jgi:hypothetical protein
MRRNITLSLLVLGLGACVPQPVDTEEPVETNTEEVDVEAIKKQLDAAEIITFSEFNSPN